ncbi:MAG: hypothetical protein ACRDS9_00150 [Pseudonocardiaceae bacterium]
MDAIGAWPRRRGSKLATDLTRIATARGHSADLTTCWRSHHQAGGRIRWEKRRHDDPYHKRRYRTE